MAETKKKLNEATAEAATPVEKQSEAASLYPVEELVAASEQLFKEPKEVVIVALKGSRKTRMSVEEAKTLVKKFLEKEVR